MSFETVNFTQIEHRLLQLTGDGKVHSVEEMLACIDQFADRKTLSFHIANLRKKLEPLGQDVIAQSFGTYIKYRRIGLIRDRVGT